jgi:hypothetical protein
MHDRRENNGRLNIPTAGRSLCKPAAQVIIEEKTARESAEKAAMRARIEAVAANARPRFTINTTNKFVSQRKISRVLNTPLEYKSWGSTPDTVVVAEELLTTPGMPKNFVLQPLRVTSDFTMVDGSFNSIIINGGDDPVNITLPLVENVLHGAPFYFTNSGDANVVVNSAESNDVVTIGAGGSANIMCVNGVWTLTTVSASNSTVLGLSIDANERAISSGDSGIAVGNAAESSGNYSIAIGGDSLAAGVGQVVAGYTAVATSAATNAVVIGLAANCQTATQSVTIGPNAHNAGASGVAIGDQATVNGINAVAIGYTAITNNAIGAVAIGPAASVTTGSNYGVAIGAASQAQTTSAIAMGNGSNAAGSLSLAIGASATAAANQTMAVGNGASCSGTGAMSVGYNAVCGTATNGMAIGNSASAQANNSLAIGYMTNVNSSSTNSIAVGQTASTTAANAIVVGPSVNGGASSIILAANTNLNNTISGVVRMATTSEIFRANAPATGGIMYNIVPATTLTPSATQLLGGWIYVNSTVTITLPTGTNMSAAVAGIWTGATFMCVLVPTSNAVTITVAGATGMVLYGLSTAAAGATVTLRFNCNGTNSWVVAM